MNKLLSRKYYGHPMGALIGMLLIGLSGCAGTPLGSHKADPVADTGPAQGAAVATPTDRLKQAAAARAGKAQGDRPAGPEKLGVWQFDVEGNAHRAFLRAALFGQTEAVRTFLADGADPMTRDHSGATVLQLAARGGSAETVKLLLAAGADPNVRDRRDQWFPLMEAAWNGYTETVRVLLEHGAAVNLKNKYGENALLQAAFEGRDETVALLLDRGADWRVRNDKGYDPMQAAATKGWVNVVKMLKMKGATPPSARKESGRAGKADNAS